MPAERRWQRARRAARERGKETPAECQHAGQTRTPRGTDGRRPGQPEAQAVSAGILETVVL